MIRKYDSPSFEKIQPHGMKPPFFCIPGRGDSVRRLFYLANRMAPDQPFYAAPCFQSNGKPIPHDCIEDLAAHYITKIKAIQPSGPYFLGGFCLGGLVAFEMAHQLIARKESLSLLALIEPDINPFPILGLKPKFCRYVYHGSRLLQLRGKDRWDYFYRRYRRVKSKAIVKMKSDCRLQREKYLQLLKRYSLKVYPEKMTLFLASDIFLKLVPESDPRLVNWSRLAAQGVDRFFVPGSHRTLLQEPHVAVLGQYLKQCIENASAVSATAILK